MSKELYMKWCELVESGLYKDSFEDWLSCQREQPSLGDE